MPKVGGLEVLSFAKRRSPPTVRILMSGDPGALDAAGDSAADHRMAKPVDSERLRVLIQLAHVAQRYAASADAVFVKETQGRYLHMNPTGVALLKRAPDEVIGRLDSEVFDEATLLEEVRGSDHEVIRTGRPYLYANTMRTTGTTRTFLSVKLPLRNRDGAMTAIACLSRDVTEILGYSPLRARRRVAVLLNDVAELAAIVGGEPPAIDRTDVERCLELPVRVPHRILVVQAVPTLAGSLRSAGHDVLAAADAAEAWRLLLQEGDAIDAIVTDIPAFSEGVRARWPGIGVLAAEGPETIEKLAALLK